jgi:hypothetical protein
VLLPAFVLAGLGIGCGETAQTAAVASLAPERLRGSAFGLLATVQAGGNLIASAVAGHRAARRRRAKRQRAAGDLVITQVGSELDCRLDGQLETSE